MQGWLIDAYRKENTIILWLKTPENTRVEWQYEAKIYMDAEAEDFLRRQNINFRRVVRKTYEKKKTVLELKVPRLEFYEKFVRPNADKNARTPIKREQTAEDIGYAVVFFASDEAKNITGQSLTVDCGLLTY